MSDPLSKRSIIDKSMGIYSVSLTKYFVFNSPNTHRHRVVRNATIRIQNIVIVCKDEYHRFESVFLCKHIFGLVLVIELMFYLFIKIVLESGRDIL